MLKSYVVETDQSFHKCRNLIQSFKEHGFILGLNSCVSNASDLLYIKTDAHPSVPRSINFTYYTSTLDRR